MKKLRNKIVMAVLVSVVMITSTASLHLLDNLPGTLNNSVEVMEHALDDGTISEEYVMENIRNGALNDSHGIGMMLYQGYLSSYKETLIAEGYVTQEDIEWGKWFVDTYLGGTGSSNEQSTPEPEQTPQPEQKPVEEQPKPEPEQSTTETVVQNDPVWIEAERVEASCTEDGYILYVNEYDKAEQKQEILPKIGDHAYTSQVTVNSTCTSEGELTYTCERCSETYTEPIPVLSHTYTSKETKAATCTSLGELTFTCDTCGDTYTEEIELLPHEMTESHISPSLFKSGLDSRYCKNCGVITTETILPQTFPLPLYVCLIIGGILICITIIICIVLIRNHKKKNTL